MKTVTIKLMARDEQEERDIDQELMDSGVLNNWPLVMWDWSVSDPAEEEWFREEYGEDEEDA